MQVSWSPTARWTSVAATAESTPPDKAQIDLAVRRPWRESQRRWCRRSSPASRSAARRRCRPRSCAGSRGRRGVDDLGVELDAVQAARRVGEPGERVDRSGPVGGSRRADARSSRRGSSTPAARGRCPRNRPSSLVIVTMAGPYSRLVGRRSLAAKVVGHELRGRSRCPAPGASLQTRGSGCGAPSS